MKDKIICQYCKGPVKSDSRSKFCCAECRTSFNYELKEKRSDESGPKLVADVITDREQSMIDAFLAKQNK